MTLKLSCYCNITFYFVNYGRFFGEELCVETNLNITGKPARKCCCAKGWLKYFY